VFKLNKRIKKKIVKKCIGSIINKKRFLFPTVFKALGFWFGFAITLGIKQIII
jgi:hypothetical protein